MANNFKLKTKANVGVTTVGIYTAPTSTTTVVIGITAANVSASNINVGIGITRPSADILKLLKIFLYLKDLLWSLCREIKLFLNKMIL